MGKENKIMDIGIWKGRILRAESVQKNMHKEWKDAIDLVNCEYFDKNSPQLDDRVDVHFANWYYNNLISLCYFRDPNLFFKSEVKKYSGFAETLDKVINKKWKQLELKQQFQDVIGSALVQPPGWIKVGYTAKIGQDVSKLKEDKEKSLIGDIKDSLMGIFKDKEEKSKLPEEQGVLDVNIEEESIFASWVPSWNVLMPDGYNRVDNMPWICEWEDMPLVDFKANPMYKNKKNIKGINDIRAVNKDSGMGQTIRKVTFNEDAGAGTSDTQTIRLYHIWDRRSRKRFTISMMSEEPHFEGDWPYHIKGFPYRELIFEKRLINIDKSNPYPVNIIKPILPQIIEQSQARTQMAKWRKRSSAIIMAQKGLLNEDDMAQLEETEALQICYLSSLQGVQMTQSPPLPNGIFDVEAEIKQDLQMATNMGQIMFAPPKGTRTATQSQIAQGGLQLKISSKQDAVEDLTVTVAKDLSLLMWQFSDREDIEELIGEKVSEDMWPDYPESMEEALSIMACIQVKVDPGSAAPPKDDTVEKKQLLDFASIMMNIAPERFKKDEFAKQMTKRFKFTKEVDKLIITMDDEERKAAEEENGFLLANHPQIVSPNTNHQIHLEEHSKAMAQGGDTPALHQHILDHAKFLGINPDDGKGKPQEGDLRPPMQSTNPEIVRQGGTKSSDIAQSAQNLGAGSRGGK